MSTSYRGAVRQLLRDRLLDAGRVELTERPWAEVTMAQIATAAGVSRQTLYNEFGSRDEFGQALVIREGSRFLDDVDQAIDEHSGEPRDALRAALERFLTLADDDPFVRLMLSDDGTAGLLPLLTTQSLPVIDWASRRLVDAVDAHWPGVEREDLDGLAETLVRLAISHVAAPREPPARTAASITRLLAPAIERMLKGGGTAISVPS